jgi:hypothetical protein
LAAAFSVLSTVRAGVGWEAFSSASTIAIRFGCSSKRKKVQAPMPRTTNTGAAIAYRGQSASMALNQDPPRSGALGRSFAASACKSLRVAGCISKGTPASSRRFFA